jgi:lipid A ethanolaminephosphotransferase
LPDCRDADLAQCAPEEVVNAYDNAVAYTDLQLAKTIDFLNTVPDLSTSLVYISDHGESLGEKGLYLHAAPYWIAPEEQKRVPMVVWMSNKFRQDLKLDYDCVRASDDAPLTQDNFFHSILGMLNIETRERNQDLDIFAPCRTAEQVGSQ